MIARNIHENTERSVCQWKGIVPARRNQKIRALPQGSDCKTRTTSSGHDFLITDISGNACVEKFPQSLVRATKRALLVLQISNRQHSRAFDYRTHLLANYPTRCDETVSSNIIEMVRKVMFQIKAHFFNPNESVSIIGLLITLKLACNTNRIHEEQKCGFSHSLIKILLQRR